MKRQNIQPDKLSKRVVGGHTLYSHVVVVEARKTIFVAGQLARDGQGNVVGKGDMRAQIKQTGENIKTALAAAGATLSDIVKTNTYVTNIEEFFKHTDVRMEYFGAMPTSTTIEVSKPPPRPDGRDRSDRDGGLAGQALQQAAEAGDLRLEADGAVGGPDAGLVGADHRLAGAPLQLLHRLE